MAANKSRSKEKRMRRRRRIGARRGRGANQKQESGWQHVGEGREHARLPMQVNKAEGKERNTGNRLRG